MNSHAQGAATPGPIAAGTALPITVTSESPSDRLRRDGLVWTAVRPSTHRNPGGQVPEPHNFRPLPETHLFQEWGALRLAKCPGNL